MTFKSAILSQSAWELLTGEGKGQRGSSFLRTLLVARHSQKVLLLKYACVFFTQIPLTRKI